MNKITIPALLLGVVMVAGIFAFMPIQEASTVHTTVLAGSTDISHTQATSTGAGNDFTITCPTDSDGCHILEAYLTDPEAGVANIDTGAVTGTINGEAITFQADGGTADNLDNAAAVAQTR